MADVNSGCAALTGDSVIFEKGLVTDIIIVMMFEEKLDPDPKSFINCYYNVNNTMTRALDRSQMAMSVELGAYEIVMIDVVFDRVVPIWGVNELPAVLEAGRKDVEDKKEEILDHIRAFNWM